MAKTSKKNCTHPRYNRHGTRCCSCDKDVGTLAPAPRVLTPGVYRLEKGVDNSAAKDGRSGDWDKSPEIAPGTFYVLTNKYYGLDKTVRYGNRIIKKGERAYTRLEPSHPAYDAVVDALVPVEEGSTSEFLSFTMHENHTTGCEFGVLQKLIDSGKISKSDFIAAMIADKEEDNG